MSSPQRRSNQSIVLDRFEVYAKLIKFQFVDTQRVYVCTDARLIDITTFNQKTIPDLVMIMYNNIQDAKLCDFVQKYTQEDKPILFAKIEKVSNKRERHEITCHEGILYMNGERYSFNKAFARAELEKYVPERLIIEY